MCAPFCGHLRELLVVRYECLSITNTNYTLGFFLRLLLWHTNEAVRKHIDVPTK